MNKRFIVVSVLLASIILLSFVIGSPMFYGIDMNY